MSALAAGRGRGRPRAARARGARTPGPDRFASVIADEDRSFVLEAVYEGYLLHYGEPRAFRGMDADLRLLAGDALYALGLSRLAERGDLEAVAELADLISATAQAQAEGRAGGCRGRLVGQLHGGSRADLSINCGALLPWPTHPPRNRSASPATPPIAGWLAPSRARP